MARPQSHRPHATQQLSPLARRQRRRQKAVAIIAVVSVTLPVVATLLT